MEGGVKSAECTGLVLYLAREVGELLGLEDQLQDGDTDSEAWGRNFESKKVVIYIYCEGVKPSEVRDGEDEKEEKVEKNE